MLNVLKIKYHQLLENIIENYKELKKFLISLIYF